MVSISWWNSASVNLCVHVSHSPFLPPLLVFLFFLNDDVCILFFLLQIFVLSQSSSPADDLYIEGQTSGDLPIDDEDGENDGSGSGSGDYGKRTIFL